ncbi:MAG TPA: cobyrinate a,c-diamide synthase [Methylomirabilota bacterium]|nr:cobyrinate a,c-diamide synthase [Methylomirabilota bacterium]
MTRVLVVAGTASGVGKTSVTLGLLAALRRRGLSVQAFKVGPDFIDPGLHAVATGRASYNLDGWMCGREAVLAAVARHAAGVDVAVVEGVMGCFDGVDGVSEAGSTAEIAKWLGAPVVLVVDASAQARSAAATVLGFERFDPSLDLAAVILNRVGGATHAGWATDAIRAACRAAVVGAIPRDDTWWAIPERHLGLHTAADGVLGGERLARMGDAVERGVDVDALLARAPARALAPPATPSARPRAVIGVARDHAFQFYYEENLELLRAAGAELIEWSPLADAEPPGVDGLYFGGGYPELDAAALADNAGCRKAVRRLVLDEGRPVYAECGGLMYLAASLEDAAGEAHEMAGVLPARVTMRPPRMLLGYLDVTLTAPTPLGPAGVRARGQEFHFSTLSAVPAEVPRAYRVAPPGGAPRAEGYLVGRALMSYVHLHFASNPALARGFVDACVEARAR